MKTRASGGGGSVGEKMAQLLLPGLEDEEELDDDLDQDTSAKLADFEDPIERPNRSSLRAKNVKLLDQLDTRYQGRKMSRKSALLEDDDGEDLGDESDDDEKLESLDGDDVESDDDEKLESLDGDDVESDENLVDDAEELESLDGDGDDQVEGSQDEGLDTLGSDEEEDDDDDEGLEKEKSKEADDDHDEQMALMSNRMAEMEKAKNTQNQLKIWDSLLEIRIRMQRILLQANQLPQTESFDGIKECPRGKELLLGESAQKGFQSVRSLCATLLSLQETLQLKNPELSSSKKRSNPMDEEITSESEEDSDSAATPTPTKSKSKGSTPPFKKRRLLTPSQFESEVCTNFTKFLPFRSSTIEKWAYKTNSPATIVSQISHILQDKERLRKKTRVKRSDYRVLCKNKNINNPTEGDGQEVGEGDEEIFDDDDFYHGLLRELIERKSGGGGGDEVGLTRSWIEVMKMRSKIKKAVDTKASKGRKIRYDVHSKLVGFMASNDEGEMTEGAINELFSSVFGGLK